MDMLQCAERRRDYLNKKSIIIEKVKSTATQECMSLLKDTSNLFRSRQIKTHRIDVRNFNRVISIDAEQGIAEVEGMMSYELLVAETLKYHCLPAVVPELKTITIGGALSGIGIESSSFRYGLVHETILQFEVLLADGRVIDCRPDNENSDLFYAFPNSYGTLGYALKITLKLIPAKPYVRLSYHHYDNPEDFFIKIQRACEQNQITTQITYIDGVIFSQNEQVMITGEFVDNAPKLSNYKYRHVYYQALRKKNYDYLTTADYIWRWDADWFWCSKVFYMQNPLLRILLGKFLLKSSVYNKIMRFSQKNKIFSRFIKLIEKPKESVIQDVTIPAERALNYLDFFQKNIGIQPVWICPIQAYQPHRQYDFFQMNPNQLYFNFGFWDSISSQKEPGYYNRLIEQKVTELGGNKSLYSSCFYTPEEFWSIYNKAKYADLKKKYDPQNKLSCLYHKCTNRLSSNSGISSH